MTATTIRFTYGLNPNEVKWVTPTEGDTVSLDTNVEAHAFPGERDSTYEAGAPGQLERLTIEHNGKIVQETRSGEGGPFACSIPLWRITRNAGSLTLVAKAYWVGGHTASATLTIATTGEFLPDGQRRMAVPQAAFSFVGDEWSHRGIKRWRLAKSALRGEDRVTLEPTGGLAQRPTDLKDVRAETKSPAPSLALEPGDEIAISAQTSAEFKARTGNVRDFTRLQVVKVKGVDGNTVILDRPLRSDFATEDGARLDKRHPLRGAGVEGLTIEQTRRIWTHGILFRHATDSWVRDVAIRKAGRNPIAVQDSSHIEIKECLLEDGWYQLGGGTSYLSFDNSFDCLAEKVWTKKLRHAPAVNWSAAGNVFRECVFEQSDANWHTAWTHENLLERSIVVAEKGSGSYGYGIYTSRHKTAHGGTGPRNVFYGNEILSPDSSIYLGGAIDGTMILYNRFLNKSGPAIVGEARSDNVLLLGNTFRVASSKEPFIRLKEKPLSGWIIRNNTVSGGSGATELPAGAIADEGGNTRIPFDAKAQGSKPPVPSIFLWQRETYPLADARSDPPQK